MKLSGEPSMLLQQILAANRELAPTLHSYFRVHRGECCTGIEREIARVFATRYDDDDGRHRRRHHRPPSLSPFVLVFIDCFSQISLKSFFFLLFLSSLGFSMMTHAD